MTAITIDGLSYTSGIIIDERQCRLPYGMWHLGTPRNPIKQYHPMYRSLQRYYARQKRSGRFDHAFLEGDMKTWTDFENMINDSSNVPFFAFDPQTHEIIAHWILSGFSGLVAQIHFNFDKRYAGEEALRLATQGFEYTFSRKRDLEPDFPLVETVVAQVPCYNKATLKFCRRMGFKQLGELQNMFYHAKRRKYVPAALLTLTWGTLIQHD